MLILAVDTSTRTGSVALMDSERLLGEVEGFLGPPHSARLFADCDALLAKSNASVSDLDLFAVSTGPGSFTGLRVGLTAVKAWAEVYGRPIAAVSSLEAIAAFADGSVPEAPIASLLDARHGQVFSGLYSWRGSEPSVLRQLRGDLLLESAEFVDSVLQECRGMAPLFASPTPELVRSILGNSYLASVRVQAVPAALASTIGRLGYSRALRGETVDALRLEANYVRRPDAEANWMGPGNVGGIGLEGQETK